MKKIARLCFGYVHITELLCLCRLPNSLHNNAPQAELISAVGHRGLMTLRQQSYSSSDYHGFTQSEDEPQWPWGC